MAQIYPSFIKRIDLNQPRKSSRLFQPILTTYSKALISYFGIWSLISKFFRAPGLGKSHLRFICVMAQIYPSFIKRIDLRQPRKSSRSFQPTLTTYSKALISYFSIWSLIYKFYRAPGLGKSHFRFTCVMAQIFPSFMKQIDLRQPRKSSQSF